MKKGFTLVELLAVIIILGVIAIIAVPTVYKVVKDSKNDLYEEQVAQIEGAAKRWAVDNASGDTYTVSITDLINEGYVENKDLYDPRDNTKMNGCVKINYSSSYKQYTYTYQENNC